MNTVFVGGREFRIGAAYRQKRGRHREPLVFLGDSERFSRPGNRYIAYRPASVKREVYHIPDKRWAEWAGAEVNP